MSRADRLYMTVVTMPSGEVREMSPKALARYQAEQVQRTRDAVASTDDQSENAMTRAIAAAYADPDSEFSRRMSGRGLMGSMT
jgi:hypothetical protein